MLTPILAALVSLAYAPILRGEYRLLPLPQGISRTLHETVPVQSAAGRKRRDALTAEGYTCQPSPLGIDHCRKLIKDAEVPESVANRVIRERWDEEILEFGEPQGEPGLVHQSPEYREWRTEQSVRFSGKAYSESFYFLGSSGIHKVRLGSETSGIEFHVNPKETQVLARFTETREPGAHSRAWTTYHLLLLYSLR